MSHFPVLVVCRNDDDPNYLLEPYSENLHVAPYRDEDGELTTYNPASKWDWYVLGGRWDGYIPLMPASKEQGADGGNSAPRFVNAARAGDVLLSQLQMTTAFISPDGVWHEVGTVGWWGIVTDVHEEQYAKEWNEMIQSLRDDDMLYLYDCHI